MASLSQEKISYFLENGYIILNNLFTLDEVNIVKSRIYALRDEANGLSNQLLDSQIHKILHKGTQFVVQKIDESIKIHRFVWAGAAEPDLLNISQQNKLLEPIAQILETRQANHIINSVHPKFSGDGVKFSIHQDIYHRRNFDPSWENINEDRSYVVCITAIDNVTRENGPIMVIPGSHKLGEMTKEELQHQDLSQSSPVLLNSGDTVCMHQYLVHYSMENESEVSRFVLVNGFSYPNANHAPYPGEGSGLLIDLIYQ